MNTAQKSLGKMKGGISLEWSYHIMSHYVTVYHNDRVQGALKWIIHVHVAIH